MKLAEQIRNKILVLPEENTFGYSELCIAKADYQTAAKALERLQKKGIIKKISKGVFYKPKQTIFGELKPDYNELLKPFLFKNGKRIAYVTSTSLYNQLGLTTQIAFSIKIASRSNRISISRGTLKASAVKSYVEVTDDNYQLLGFLDAIKDIKTIPDAEVKTSVKIIGGKIKKLNDKQIKEMIQYGIMYPPRARALLGAILENIDSTIDTKALKESLNPLTKIKIGLKETELPTINNWYIV
jgi:hypothetical protein